MDVAGHGFHHHGGAHLRPSDSAKAMLKDMAEAAPSRGERVVARLDRDGDGAIGLGELQDTKLGRRMKVDHFARLDGNGDGALDAAEIDAGRGRGHKYGHYNHAQGPAMMESVVRANYADFLAQRMPAEDDGPRDVAARVIDRLDGDGSGALNSEEIAGTRLAGMIGDGFHALDADKNGALDEGELTGFVTEHLLGAPAEAPEAAEDAETEGLADPVAAGEGVAAPEAADGIAPLTASADDAVTDAAPDVTDGAEATGAAWAAAAAPAASGSAADQAQRIASAFETALEILRAGPGGSEPYDVVQALYGDVKTILGAS